MIITQNNSYYTNSYFSFFQLKTLLVISIPSLSVEMGSVLTICSLVMVSLIVRTNQMRNCSIVVSVKWELYFWFGFIVLSGLVCLYFMWIIALCLSLTCISEAKWLDFVCPKMWHIIIYLVTRIFLEEYCYGFYPWDAN